MSSTTRRRSIPTSLGAIAAALMLAACSRAATHRVHSGRQVKAIIKSGKLSAGDTILWADGEYDNESLNVEGANGTASKPITLRAATPGGVILRGKSSFRIGARWWVIEGFHFDGGSGGANSYNPVQFRSGNGTAAEHVRMTQCAMTNLTVAGGSSKWVLVYGRFNRIDHCHFSGKDSKGALITMELGYLKANETAEHRIEWNYFGNVAPQAGTDNETIRVGYSGDQNKPAKCLIRHNYFVRCNGENEIISNKSSYNTYFANTFRQCDGALVLRHGHHARVEGNYFFGDGAKNAGGIRVVDSHHVIINNYLQDLTGTTWNAAFSILGGKQASGGKSNGYQAVDDVVLAHNSIIRCKRSIYLSAAKGKRAPTGVVANNLISGSDAPLILEDVSAGKMNWKGNLLYGAKIGASVEAITSDPKLQLEGGLYRPGRTGAAVNAAVDIDVKVDTDVDGQARPSAKQDIGADEVDGARGIVSRPPLKPADVGPRYLRGGGPKQIDTKAPDRAPSASAEPPARLLDLTCWKLTLPVSKEKGGRAVEIQAPGLRSFVDARYFFVDEQRKGVVLRAPCDGATTKGSKFPRCELREMTAQGGSAKWGTDDGQAHEMTMRVAFTQTPVKKSTWSVLRFTMPRMI